MKELDRTVRLQRRVTRNVSGKRFYNHYLTVPSEVVERLRLEPGALFEPVAARDGRIIYMPKAKGD